MKFTVHDCANYLLLVLSALLLGIGGSWVNLIIAAFGMSYGLVYEEHRTD